MRPVRLQSRGGNAGFTLVEALAATVLMGMVLTALATITAQWLPNWNRGFARIQRTELVEIALERLVADVSAAEFVSANRKTTRPLFEGAELGVTFVRAAFGPNARSGLEIVRIAETADRQGPALVRSRAPFAPASTPADQSRFGDPVVLLRAPYRVTFSYAGRDRVWKSTWLEARELPAAVRLTIRDAATQRALSVSTATVIHTQLPADCAGAADGRRECGGAKRDGAAPAKPETDASDSSPSRSR
jgi:general secretion pathway protein J